MSTWDRKQIRQKLIKILRDTVGMNYSDYQPIEKFSNEILTQEDISQEKEKINRTLVSLFGSLFFMYFCYIFNIKTASKLSVGPEQINILLICSILLPLANLFLMKSRMVRLESQSYALMKIDEFIGELSVFENVKNKIDNYVEDVKKTNNQDPNRLEQIISQSFLANREKIDKIKSNKDFNELIREVLFGYRYEAYKYKGILLIPVIVGSMLALVGLMGLALYMNLKSGNNHFSYWVAYAIYILVTIIKLVQIIGTKKDAIPVRDLISPVSIESSLKLEDIIIGGLNK